MNDKTHGERVRASILAAGLDCWRFDPATVTARRIGRTLEMSHCNVLYHFGSAAALKDAIAAEAVRIGDTKIIPMLIAAKHPAVADMPGVDRARFLRDC
jgi:hypothetical protein